MRRLLQAIWRFVIAFVFVAVVTAAPTQAQETVHVVQPGDTLSALAVRYGTTVDEFVRVNGLANRNLIHVGQRLLIPGRSEAPPPPQAPPPVETEPASPLHATPIEETKFLPAPFADVRLSTDKPVQGQTVRVIIALTQPAEVWATFRTQTLKLVSHEEGSLWGLVAIGPLAPTETFPLTLSSTVDGQPVALEIPITIREGNFRTQNVRLDPNTSQLLEGDLIEKEAARLDGLFKTGQAAPLWSGRFVPPSNGRITADFGERRRYNDGDVRYHEGIDYGLATGTPVFAAAAGVVALAERLTVRGNAVFVDHGMGVYTGYFHMSQLLVDVGESVVPGQIIGRVGSTGLSTGPHLHWEIRLNGVNVSPWQWSQTAFP